MQEAAATADGPYRIVSDQHHTLTIVKIDVTHKILIDRETLAFPNNISARESDGLIAIRAERAIIPNEFQVVKDKVAEIKWCHDDDTKTQPTSTGSKKVETLEQLESKD